MNLTPMERATAEAIQGAHDSGFNAALEKAAVLVEAKRVHVTEPEERDHLYELAEEIRGLKV